MSTEISKYVLWLAAPMLQLGVLFFMCKRNLRQEFPFFFNYTLFRVVSDAALFVVFQESYKSYFYAYWTSSVLGICLGFAVLFEVFAYSLRPYPGLRDLATLAFRWAALLLLLVSGLVAASGSGTEMHKLTLAIMGVERSIRLMQCGLLLFIVMCSSYLGLSMRNFACGVAVGFGVFAATDLIILSVRTQMGSEVYGNMLGLFASAIYNISVLVWLGYSAIRQPARERVGMIYRPLFDRWNQAALLVVGNRATVTGDSRTYLSEIEQTVENVLSLPHNGGVARRA